MLAENEETERPVKISKTQFPVDPKFLGMSYNQRYQEMLNRFIGKQIYQGGWFITTRIDETGRATYNEPLPTATGATFKAAVKGRVDWVKAVFD